MTSRGLAAGLCVLLTATVPYAGRAGTREPTPFWDTNMTGQNGQLTIYNSDPSSTNEGMPCGAGDLDGDGFDDAVLCPFLAPAGPSNERSRAGKLHVYFGRAGAIAGVVDQTAPPPGTVTVYGARAGDLLGNEVDVADVTKDPFADILACAQNADGFGTDTSRPGAGALYVIHGRAAWPSVIDLATATDDVTTILGATAGERCGFWAAAGDVNGDGVKDILVSADLAASSAGEGAARGKLYVIPGGQNLPARIDLANAQQVAQLKITVIYGVDDCDHFGSCIASADFDRDGFDDIVCSAGLARLGGISSGKTADTACAGARGGGGGPANDRFEAGEVYVIYGRASMPAIIHLASPTPDVAIYYGQNAGDHFGEDVRTGDFDGDGVPELAVGALTASAPSGVPGQPSRTGSGVGYLFRGADLRRGERVDVRDLTSATTRLVRIYAQAARDTGADTIALVDVDGDGLAEIVFASPTNTPPDPLHPGSVRASAGDVKVIFGTRDPLPSIVDLASPPASVPVYRIIAADPGDMFAYSFAAGDFDGDGFTDLMPNAMGGAGLNNCCALAGELYVLSGREFAARAGRGPAAAPCLTRVSVAPAAPRYYAGQAGVALHLFCDGQDAAVKFRDGAVAILNGVEVAATFVSPSELVVRLDDAPEVRNAAGTVAAAVRNPGSDASTPIVALALVGPEIASVTAKRHAGGFRLTIKGDAFLAGAVVRLEDAGGTEVPVAAVVRKSARKLRATIAAGVLASGAVLSVRVLNPGPAPSAPASVMVP